MQHFLKKGQEAKSWALPFLNVNGDFRKPSSLGNGTYIEVAYTKNKQNYNLKFLFECLLGGGKVIDDKTLSELIFSLNQRKNTRISQVKNLIEAAKITAASYYTTNENVIASEKGEAGLKAQLAVYQTNVLNVKTTISQTVTQLTTIKKTYELQEIDVSTTNQKIVVATNTIKSIQSNIEQIRITIQTLTVQRDSKAVDSKKFEDNLNLLKTNLVALVNEMIFEVPSFKDVLTTGQNAVLNQYDINPLMQSLKNIITS